jgi:hypothetical protein
MRFEYKFRTTKGFLESKFIFLFGLAFYTSWLYEIRALGSLELYGFKNIILLTFMLMLATSIKWRDIKLDIFFTVCGLWLLCSIFSWILHQGPMLLNLRRIGQTIFCFLFVTYLRSHPHENPISALNIKRWFFGRWVFAISLILMLLNLTGWLTLDFEHGFGNSRGAFCIWLMQLVALYLFSNLVNKDARPNILFYALVLITPVFILQNMTAGRTGMIGSVLLICVFTYQWGGLRAMLVSVLWLYIVALGVAHFNPLITSSNNMDVFRNSRMPNFHSLQEFHEWLDRFSSYRLSIIETAFSGLDFRGYLVGVGIGNFLGFAPSYPNLGSLEVHNVFLKIFGEYGISGFISATALSLLPAFSKSTRVEGMHFLNVLFVYLVVSMLHPDLMLTAINLSFVYLSAYAQAMSTRYIVQK